jgi:peptidyl-prolyl cis-trans isomerase A (cyclophilin A)
VRARHLRLLILLAAILPAAGCGTHRPAGVTPRAEPRTQARAVNPRVLVETELGDITLEVFEREAPVTAANFLRYVREGRYKDASFYRAVRMNNQPDKPIKIEVIQGGLGDDEAGRALPAIAHETTAKTGILHKDGTVSMARAEPGTASSEIFISIGDQPELDFGGRRNPDGQGFAAFGRVISGMDVVRRIQAQPADGQWLNPKIKITGVRLLSD